MRQIAYVLGLAMLFALLGCVGGGAPSDSQPPRIKNLQIQPSDLVASGTQVTVQATVTDEMSGVKKVSVKVTYPNGQEQVVEMSLQADSQFSATFKAGWEDNSSPQNYESWVIRFVVIAVDNSGNEAASEERKVRAAISPPNLPPDF